MKRNMRIPLILIASWTAFIFGVLLVLVLLFFVLDIPLYKNSTITLPNMLGGLIISFIVTAVVSIPIGIAVAIRFGLRTLRPIREVINGINKVANGDFSVRLNNTTPKGYDDLKKLSQNFNKMVRGLASNEAMQRDFMSNFSHELRTPLTSISGFAKLLIDKNFNADERREYLEVIVRESERLTALSINMLDLSKYEALEIVTDKKSFRLDEQIRLIVMLMESKWSEKELDVMVELDEVLFDGNEELTHHIWMNLMDNAIKFSRQSGTIHIKLTQSNGNILFSIQDNGIGMDTQTQKYIFDKFFQGDKSRSHAGYGLGLALVKRAAVLCGGSISLQSTSKKGSTFSVTLPSAM